MYNIASSLRAWHPPLRTIRARKRGQTHLRSYLATLVSVPVFLGATVGIAAICPVRKCQKREF